eukprot:3643465-Prymnesium_polylepis.1
MDLSSAAPPSIRCDAPGFDPSSAGSLPWIWGNAGVANSILDGHKTVETRSLKERGRTSASRTTLRIPIRVQGTSGWRSRRLSAASYLYPLLKAPLSWSR